MNPKAAQLHVGLILDGNRRYAKKNNLTPSKTYKIAIDRAFEIYEACLKNNVAALTFFVMSLDNLSRPKKEKEALFKALETFVDRLSREAEEYGIRVRIIGGRGVVPEGLQKKLDTLEEESRLNTRLLNFLAVGYSGHQDILDAVNISRQRFDGQGHIDEALLEKNISTVPFTRVDFIIRTGGDKRLSDFLLWQASYAELYFTKKTFPEFTKEDFTRALREFYRRERRFGL